MNMETGVSPQGRTLSIRTNSGPYDTVVVDMNSYIFESTLATNGFQLVVYGRILHFSAPSIDVTAAWIYHLRDVIADCGTYPSDPLFKEALLRQPGESYDIKFLEKRTTGVVFERTLEWAYVKSGTDVVEEGSLLSSVNGAVVRIFFFLRQFTYCTFCFRLLCGLTLFRGYFGKTPKVDATS